MKKEISKEEIEANNLLEQASEIMSDCVNCGICKSMCPIFRILKEERVSGRGQAILLRNKILTSTIFESDLSLGQEAVCPKDVKISKAILKAREAAVLLGKGVKENEEMIERVRKYGNPYGKAGEEKIDKVYS